jgi:hypothetical protein
VRRALLRLRVASGRALVTADRKDIRLPAD